MCTAHSLLAEHPQAADEAPANPFAEKLLETINHAGVALMISIGHRTGLFNVLASGDALTSQELADRAGLVERYVREWLGAMTTGGIVTLDRTTRRYRLPPEHAEFLGDDAPGGNMANMFQFIAVLGGVESRIVEAFRSGGGVPYEAFDRFHAVMADESGQTVLPALIPSILPLIPGLTARLEAGIDVVDVGCGAGRALNLLAREFPNSRFTGYDLCEETVAQAQAEARAAGLTNVRFVKADATNLDDTAAFDLALTFDAVHDQAQPAKVLANIRRALRPGGAYLMQDIHAASDVADNLDQPLAPFIYTISCMHCMTVSLAQGGVGLGAAWGQQVARRMLADAGFGAVEVHQLPHDIMNDYYVCRP